MRHRSRSGASAVPRGDRGTASPAALHAWRAPRRASRPGFFRSRSMKAASEAASGLGYWLEHHLQQHTCLPRQSGHLEPDRARRWRWAPRSEAGYFSATSAYTESASTTLPAAANASAMPNCASGARSEVGNCVRKSENRGPGGRRRPARQLLATEFHQLVRSRRRRFRRGDDRGRRARHGDRCSDGGGSIARASSCVRRASTCLRLWPVSSWMVGGAAAGVVHRHGDVALEALQRDRGKAQGISDAAQGLRDLAQLDPPATCRRARPARRPPCSRAMSPCRIATSPRVA